ncbi:MAG: hypothetical protein ACO39T_09180 [Flavobacteriaceae bacterium]
MSDPFKYEGQDTPTIKSDDVPNFGDLLAPDLASGGRLAKYAKAIETRRWKIDPNPNWHWAWLSAVEGVLSDACLVAMQSGDLPEAKRIAQLGNEFLVPFKYGTIGKAAGQKVSRSIINTFTGEKRHTVKYADRDGCMATSTMDTPEWAECQQKAEVSMNNIQKGLDNYE